MSEFWPTPIPRLSTQHHVLILQHPQEPDQALGTAALAHAALPESTLTIGLSWPNLKKALGYDVHPGNWAVLYLGSGIKGPIPARAPRPSSEAKSTPEICLVNKQGVPLANSAQVLSEVEGLVVLDGTWSQAKALWWRNAWLLKLRRAVLLPTRASLYGPLRKEPRRECLSTIESIALSLAALGEPDTVRTELQQLFVGLLDNYRKRASAENTGNSENRLIKANAQP